MGLRAKPWAPQPLAIPCLRPHTSLPPIPPTQVSSKNLCSQHKRFFRTPLQHENPLASPHCAPFWPDISLEENLINTARASDIPDARSWTKWCLNICHQRSPFVLKELAQEYQTPMSTPHWLGTPQGPRFTAQRPGTRAYRRYCPGHT